MRKQIWQDEVYLLGPRVGTGRIRIQTGLLEPNNPGYCAVCVIYQPRASQNAEKQVLLAEKWTLSKAEERNPLSRYPACSAHWLLHHFSESAFCVTAVPLHNESYWMDSCYNPFCFVLGPILSPDYAESFLVITVLGEHISCWGLGTGVFCVQGKYLNLSILLLCLLLVFCFHPFFILGHYSQCSQWWSDQTWGYGLQSITPTLWVISPVSQFDANCSMVVWDSSLWGPLNIPNVLPNQYYMDTRKLKVTSRPMLFT